MGSALKRSWLGVSGGRWPGGREGPPAAAWAAGPPKQRVKGIHGLARCSGGVGRGASPHPLSRLVLMILPQVHLRKPCYDFYFL